VKKKILDQTYTDQGEQALRAVPGVLDVGQVRLRWIGRQLRAECEIVVDPAWTAVASHQVTVAPEHALLHALPRLSAALVHADPQPAQGTDYHAPLAPHRTGEAFPSPLS
jgi:divalent metal cation (Fe/Co/Zn/Cd) transporter